MNYQVIADKILELIDGSNINQFCKNIGLNQSNTNKFLKGKKYSISLEDLSKIANYYNLPLDYFFNKESEAPALVNDANVNAMVSFIREFLSNAPDDTKTWFHEQFKRSFSDYREWLEKRENKKSKNPQAV